MPFNLTAIQPRKLRPSSNPLRAEAVAAITRYKVKGVGWLTGHDPIFRRQLDGCTERVECRFCRASITINVRTGDIERASEYEAPCRATKGASR